MREELFTSLIAKRLGIVLSAPIFSGPDDCPVLVFSL